ncbi:MAG: GGDEF domain-containing phosphodiesterase [Candidatus Nanopelagicales bacterium]
MTRSRSLRATCSLWRWPTRIRSVQPDPDLITRGSGAEFLIAMLGLAAGADAARAAEELLAACTVSVTIAGHTIEPTISIGIAAGRPGAHADDLVRDAALAMREAKRSGHNRYQFAEPQLATEARERLVMEEQVRAGLRHGQFVPWYQPVTALTDGALVGYEALVRWDRGDGADVPPDEFLPHAERTGLITELDFEVLRQVVAQVSRLPTALTVAVNVSPTTLRLPDYAGRVLGTLRDAGESPTRLHLEVAETALLSATHRISQSMAELADAGVQWYDFGTGYSSIVHLRDLPVAGLKLDKSFTAGWRRTIRPARDSPRRWPGWRRGSISTPSPKGSRRSGRPTSCEPKGGATAKAGSTGTPGRCRAGRRRR